MQPFKGQIVLLIMKNGWSYKKNIMLMLGKTDGLRFLSPHDICTLCISFVFLHMLDGTQFYLKLVLHFIVYDKLMLDKSWMK